MTADETLAAIRDWAEAAASTVGMRDVPKARRAAGFEVLALLTGADPQVAPPAPGWVPGDGLAGHVEQFTAHVLRDALQEAEAAYWDRRAEAFEDVVTERADEHVGAEETDETRAARRSRCLRTATRCRNRAAAIRAQAPGYITNEVERLMSA